MKANVSTEDLWSAIDALDALPETHETEWYKRLVEAAELLGKKMIPNQ